MGLLGNNTTILGNSPISFPANPSRLKRSGGSSPLKQPLGGYILAGPRSLRIRYKRSDNNPYKWP